MINSNTYLLTYRKSVFSKNSLEDYKRGPQYVSFETKQPYADRSFHNIS